MPVKLVAPRKGPVPVKKANACEARRPLHSHVIMSVAVYAPESPECHPWASEAPAHAQW